MAEPISIQKGHPIIVAILTWARILIAPETCLDFSWVNSIWPYPFNIWECKAITRMGVGTFSTFRFEKKKITLGQ